LNILNIKYINAERERGMHETRNVCTNIRTLYIIQLSKIQKASRIVYYTMCIYYTAANGRQIPDRERKNERVRIFQNSDLIGKGMILQENKIKL